eukprot:362730_1
MAETVYDAMSDKFASDATAMSPASVLMSSIYGAHNEYDKSEAIWNERVANGWTKPEGISEVYIDGIVHRFVAGSGYKTQSVEYESIDDKLLELRQR